MGINDLTPALKPLASIINLIDRTRPRAGFVAPFEHPAQHTLSGRTSKRNE